MTGLPEKLTEDVSNEEWMDRLKNNHLQRSEMNALIMNYLITEGFKEAAEKFQTESGLKPGGVDFDQLDERIRIRDAIQNGQIEEGIAMINQRHPELLDNDRYLFFHLQQQHLIELIRRGMTEEALHYAQEHLAERGEENPEILFELERTLALLAFDEPEKSPFGDLLHPSHRQKVAGEINAAILKLDEQATTQPYLTILLKQLMWSQEELDGKKIRYPRMTDLARGTIETASTSK